ncbi:universal stress protein [Streptomyces griseosporeus]|uniref:universal stress protein n=1 Tax=Streptomyces griseosporeus TaxID=1910 RepID=UPI00167CB8A5|nr:universal stress protein [Streptomyces griseosporeus]GHF37486.1 universal stress protein [Streptomyces griseosporeus]
MELPVVVGVDGSEASLRATSWAADEAALRGLTLRVVYASLWERYEGSLPAVDPGRPAEEVLAEDIIGTAARRARRRQPDLKVIADLVPDEAEYALVRESADATLLVVGSRGRSGVAETLLGSVSMAVAARADCPVVVLRGSHDDQAATAARGRVVVGVGDGAEVRAVVAFAAAEARLRGVPLHAVRAWKCPAHEPVDHPLLVGEPARVYEQRAADALEAALAAASPEPTVYRRTAEGHARRVLVEASHEADLLVVGVRRRADHYTPQLGRTAHAVLHRAACPVAVVPHR